MQKLFLFHGSDKTIKTPTLQKENVRKDFGYGFYLAESEVLAKEWALKDKREKGIVNIYEFDLNQLQIINLYQETINAWLELVYSNLIRYINKEEENIIQETLSKYPLIYEEIDVIIGNRADGQFNLMLVTYLKGEVSKETLMDDLANSNPESQIVLRTEKALANLKFVDSVEVINSEIKEKTK